MRNSISQSLISEVPEKKAAKSTSKRSQK